MSLAERILIATGGLAGAAGVALSAAAAHAGGAFTGTVATMLLVHAPALLAIGLLGGAFGGKLLRLGAYCLLIGLLLFTGDLLARDYGGQALFSMAAPTGGTLMILGWLIVAAAAFMPARTR
ncbi:DUF423 domain-containing protein [Pseudaminobacter sp. 19-2017]|uniref:DUF423 domain-containing protein n=1 Tax=Pseudaminobacter soli (ex Zhang et al. 2022) TaxID=2831468 RepID=A0A942E055_9HYPH|nr:DUF423 domain-containing protein [Pseudaminobacter soli]MBS3651414.1 DUF423 domain-containing protein [Pseudaminobacter soli]